jgi:hypothetical protein
MQPHPRKVSSPRRSVPSLANCAQAYMNVWGRYGKVARHDKKRQDVLSNLSETIQPDQICTRALQETFSFEGKP